MCIVTVAVGTAVCVLTEDGKVYKCTFYIVSLATPLTGCPLTGTVWTIASLTLPT